MYIKNIRKERRHFFLIVVRALCFLAVNYGFFYPTYGIAYSTWQEDLKKEDSTATSTQRNDLSTTDTTLQILDTLALQDSSLLSDTTVVDSVPRPVLERPFSLTPLPIERVYPYKTIDQLITKQVVNDDPYIPFLQEISVGIEVLSLLSNTWQLAKNIRKYDAKRSYAYEGTGRMLFRKNVRFVLDIGYASLYPEPLKKNRYRYQAVGLYGRIGLDYVIPYKPTEYFYIGGRYGSAWFENHTLEPVGHKKDLTASWSEVLVGAESGFLDKFPLYGGCILRSAWLIDYVRYRPATNYDIPGYGLNANTFIVGIEMYLLYKFSFLERMIRVM